MSKKHKYHYIYKTTCTVTGKYYIGMHSTSNLDDGYIGSGKRLWLSINKHGRENHSREILEFLDDRSSLKNREIELVNESIVNDPMCMNLQLGGGGGFINSEHQLKCSLAGAKKGGASLSRKLKTDAKFKTKYKVKLSKVKQESLRLGRSKIATFKGLVHTSDTKERIGKANSISQSGARNSQFGKVWIFSNRENRSISVNKNEVEQYLANGWKLGRIIKTKSS